MNFKRGRGRPKKQTTTQPQDASVNLDLGDNLLDQYKIKHCSVKLTPINIEQSAMDDTSPAPVAPKRRGRKPKNLLAAKVVATPSKTEPSDDTKPELKTDEKNDEKIEEKTETNANESIEKIDKPPKLSLSERKLAKKAETEAIIASGGRGKRTPKPNPRYIDEPPVSANKRLKDEFGLENADAEDGDDEMNQSSDEPRNEGPLKKRMLQKVGIKSGPGRKPGSGKGTPGRKPAGAVSYKRKLEVDIDIDDEHGKQLFLDAKRRFQNSPSASDDETQFKKSKSPVTDALAAKLRSKYPHEFTVKRTITLDNKISPISRARLLERSKIAIEKDGSVELRQRKLTEDTETSEDDFGTGKGTSDQETSSPKNNNRRKTQHTKILSDDKVVRASSSAASAQIVRKQFGGATGASIVAKQMNKSPLTQNQLSQSKGHAATKTYSISSQSRVIGASKPAILRQPPRILNSTLCKPTNKATVPSLVTKVVTKDDYEHELNKKRNNNIISSRSKENNVTSYVYTEKDGKMIPKRTVQQISPQQKLMQQRKTVLPVVRTPSSQQRIISEPVTMNIPNSRRIRKITCFETWYVIKMAEEHPKIEKSILSLSLMQIGNEIKKIELPSSEWTYKILLQPLSKQLLELQKTKANEKVANNRSIASKDNKQAAEKSVEKHESDNKSDSKDCDEKSGATEESEDATQEDTTSTKAESSDAPKDEKSTEESAGDDEKEEEEEKEKTEEESDEKADANTEEKPEEKTEENVDLTAEDSTETKSSETNAEETEEKKSDVEAKEETDEKEENTEESDESSNKHDVYTGEVHDPNINPNERHNYRPINIMFRRKCQNPNIRIQFDRTVILKNQTFYLNVDGKNVRLVASPQQIETYDDIETLLQIVNDISLNSCCVEPATQIS